MHRYLILAGYLLSAIGLTSLQAQPGSWGLGLTYSQGNTLRHRSTMVFALPRPAQALSLEAIRQTDGRRYAEAVLHRFRWGMGATWLNYGGHRDELGYAWAVYPFFDLPLLRNARLSLWARMSMGLAYVDRTYDRVHNPINNAIGSHINNYTAVALLGELRVSPRWSLRVGGSFAHQSNAKYAQPNLGLNTAKLQGGLTYRWRVDEAITPFVVDEVPFDRRVHVGGRVGLGLTEKNAPNGPQYPVVTSALYVSRRVARGSKFFTGFEYSYEAEVRAFMIDNDIPPGTPRWYPNKTAWLFGYELGCGHFGMSGQYLLYLQRLPEGKLSAWGTKFGPHIYLKNQDRQPRSNVFFAVYLLTEVAVAKYFETSIGVIF
jgi:hypothetical protein